MKAALNTLFKCVCGGMPLSKGSFPSSSQPAVFCLSHFAVLGGCLLGVLAVELRVGRQLQRAAADWDGAAVPWVRLWALAYRHGQARGRVGHRAADYRLLHPDASQGRRKVMQFVFLPSFLSFSFWWGFLFFLQKSGKDGSFLFCSHTCFELLVEANCYQYLNNMFFLTA